MTLAQCLCLKPYSNITWLDIHTVTPSTAELLVKQGAVVVLHTFDDATQRLERTGVELDQKDPTSNAAKVWKVVPLKA